MKNHYWFTMLVALGPAIGCAGVNDVQRQDDEIAVSAQAVSGTADFGEVAVAPTMQNGTALVLDNADTQVRALVVDGSSLYVGGTISITSGSKTFANLLKFTIPDAPGAPLKLDENFVAQFNGGVWAIAVANGKIYAGGGFTQVYNNDAKYWSNRNGLAALNATTGAVDHNFNAKIQAQSTSYVPNPDVKLLNTGWGVHALAVNGSQLLVGGNFATVNGASRSGLAAVTLDTGAIGSGYTVGVGGFVRTFMVLSGNVFVGGAFSATTNGDPRPGIMVTDNLGALQSAQFGDVGIDIHDIDYDPSNGGRLIVGCGDGTNAMKAVPIGGGNSIWTAKAQGDVQTVKYYNGNVYFGFHDGLLVPGTTNQVSGDEYKVAAVNTDGKPLKDNVHGSEPCIWWSSWVHNCWAPRSNSNNKPFGTPGSGAMGVWALETFTNSSGQARLIVGGEVNIWFSPSGIANPPDESGVNSKLLTSFGP